MKILSIVLALLILATNVFASEEQRKVSSGREASSAQVTNVKTTVYDIEIMATGANAVAAIMDSSTTATPTGTTASNTLMKIEIGEATSGNSKHVSLGQEGLKLSNGAYLYLSNASAIIYYR